MKYCEIFNHSKSSASCNSVVVYGFSYVLKLKRIHNEFSTRFRLSFSVFYTLRLVLLTLT